MSSEVDNDREPDANVPVMQMQAELIANAVRKAMPAQSAPLYESFTVTIPANSAPAFLIGMDLSRTRLMVQASGPAVYVGHRSQLAAGRGFIIPVGTSVELRTTDEIFVSLIDPLTEATTVDVSVWVEKVAN